jgi:glycosyltransferase involved in cell wall biosynthesis
MDQSLTVVIEASAVIATNNRSGTLRRALTSLAEQTTQPAELIIIDASSDTSTEDLCLTGIAGLRSDFVYRKASAEGAGAQRNQGASTATQRVIWFLDDDIVFEPFCVERLWKALQSDPQFGGVNAMIINQTYGKPGLASRFMFSLMNGKREPSYAGRVIGPAINLLPEDSDRLSEIVRMEWLNTTCTMYRREALPAQPFNSFFVGYSLMEDLALSLEVGKKWKLANVRTARIFHDSKGGGHKSDLRSLSCMELTNRHFVMKHVMGKSALTDYVKLIGWELFSLASVAADKKNWKHIPVMLRGKWMALRNIVKEKPRI